MAELSSSPQFSFKVSSEEEFNDFLQNLIVENFEKNFDELDFETLMQIYKLCCTTKDKVTHPYQILVESPQMFGDDSSTNRKIDSGIDDIESFSEERFYECQPLYEEISESESLSDSYSSTPLTRPYSLTGLIKIPSKEATAETIANADRDKIDFISEISNKHLESILKKYSTSHGTKSSALSTQEQPHSNEEMLSENIRVRKSIKHFSESDSYPSLPLRNTSSTSNETDFPRSSFHETSTLSSKHTRPKLHSEKSSIVPDSPIISRDFLQPKQKRLFQKQRAPQYTPISDIPRWLFQERPRRLVKKTSTSPITPNLSEWLFEESTSKPSTSDSLLEETTSQVCEANDPTSVLQKTLTPLDEPIHQRLQSHKPSTSPDTPTLLRDYSQIRPKRLFQKQRAPQYTPTSEIPRWLFQERPRKLVKTPPTSPITPNLSEWLFKESSMFPSKPSTSDSLLEETSQVGEAGVPTSVLQKTLTPLDEPIHPRLQSHKPSTSPDTPTILKDYSQIRPKRLFQKQRAPQYTPISEIPRWLFQERPRKLVKTPPTSPITPNLSEWLFEESTVLSSKPSTSDSLLEETTSQVGEAGVPTSVLQKTLTLLDKPIHQRLQSHKPSTSPDTPIIPRDYSRIQRRRVFRTLNAPEYTPISEIPRWLFQERPSKLVKTPPTSPITPNLSEWLFKESSMFTSKPSTSDSLLEETSQVGEAGVPTSVLQKTLTPLDEPIHPRLQSHKPFTSPDTPTILRDYSQIRPKRLFQKQRATQYTPISEIPRWLFQERPRKLVKTPPTSPITPYLSEWLFEESTVLPSKPSTSDSILEETTSQVGEAGVPTSVLQKTLTLLDKPIHQRLQSHKPSTSPDTPIIPRDYSQIQRRRVFRTLNAPEYTPISEIPRWLSQERPRKLVKTPPTSPITPNLSEWLFKESSILPSKPSISDSLLEETTSQVGETDVPTSLLQKTLTPLDNPIRSRLQLQKPSTPPDTPTIPRWLFQERPRKVVQTPLTSPITPNLFESLFKESSILFSKPSTSDSLLEGTTSQFGEEDVPTSPLQKTLTLLDEPISSRLQSQEPSTPPDTPTTPRDYSQIRHRGLFQKQRSPQYTPISEIPRWLFQEPSRQFVQTPLTSPITLNLSEWLFEESSVLPSKPTSDSLLEETISQVGEANFGKLSHGFQKPHSSSFTSDLPDWLFKETADQSRKHFQESASAHDSPTIRMSHLQNTPVPNRHSTEINLPNRTSQIHFRQRDKLSEILPETIGRYGKMFIPEYIPFDSIKTDSNSSLNLIATTTIIVDGEIINQNYEVH